MIVKKWYLGDGKSYFKELFLFYKLKYFVKKMDDMAAKKYKKQEHEALEGDDQGRRLKPYSDPRL